MAFQLINVGTVANDGTGDPLRTAFIKVNTNYGTIDAAFALLPHDGSGNIIAAAPINSPVFTGDPRVPTPPNADNDTSIANTQWVRANFAHFDPANPPVAGTDLAAYAPLDSPHFIGVPTAPTAPTTTNNTQLATTAFVKAALAAASFTPSPTPPATPVPGQFWYDLSTGVLAIWIDDGTSTQWVGINGLVTVT